MTDAIMHDSAEILRFLYEYEVPSEFTSRTIVWEIESDEGVCVVVFILGENNSVHAINVCDIMGRLSTEYVRTIRAAYPRVIEYEEEWWDDNDDNKIKQTFDFGEEGGGGSDSAGAGSSRHRDVRELLDTLNPEILMGITSKETRVHYSDSDGRRKSESTHLMRIVRNRE